MYIYEQYYGQVGLLLIFEGVLYRFEHAALLNMIAHCSYNIICMHSTDVGICVKFYVHSGSAVCAKLPTVHATQISGSLLVGLAVSRDRNRSAPSQR